MTELFEPIGNLLQAFGQFRFLRPGWLLVVIPALIASVTLRRTFVQAGSWSRVISPQLLPWLTDNSKAASGRNLLAPVAFALWLIAALALSGPSWKQIPVPVQKNQQALVILLDLSPSMLAEDIKPSRLIRARLKLLDFLQARKEGLSALIVYAGDAHVVTPLTDDTRTISALVPALTPGIMPISGNHPELAITRALQLLDNGGHLSGDLLLISDGLPASALKAISHQLDKHGGVTLSVLGMGTADGAPIPIAEGGFYKDRDGSIVIARYHGQKLRQLSKRYQGVYVELAHNDDDIQQLLSISKVRENEASLRQAERTFDQYEDQGYWLALILLPFVILAFRRNFLVLIILLPLLSHSPPVSALDWQDLWLRADQRGNEAFKRGDLAGAKEQFTDPDWQATAAYRNGDYEAAARLFAQNPDAIGHYNRGNALAKAGDYDSAIAAYDQALELLPSFEDAEANRKLLENLKEQQESQQKDDSSPSDHNGEPSSDSQNSQTDQQTTENNDAQNSKSSSDTPGQQNPEPDKAGKPDSEGDESDGEEHTKNKSNKDETVDHDQQQNQAADTHSNTQAGNSSADKPIDNPAETETEQGKKPAHDLAADPQSREQKQAHEQWLRSLPDDPSNLMRRKFLYEAQNRRRDQSAPKGDQQW